MKNCFFVSDIHGRKKHYEKLFNSITTEKPSAVFLGGDLLPHRSSDHNFVKDFLVPEIQSIKNKLADSFPRIFLILGNDDARLEEKHIIDSEESGIWEYTHFKNVDFEDYKIFGYNYTSPSPFLLKDWEKYDVSRYADPGCISPEEGKRTIEISSDEKKYSTIKKDIEILTENFTPGKSVFLFHSPPYQSNLDRAALDGKLIDQIPVDLHVGSIAVKRFIEQHQPYITLHGHIHESAAITGSWQDRIGKTYCFSAAHDGSELAIVKFDLDHPSGAERILV
ncbi:MAG: hypothetical protein CVV24_12030 [Ignavibacteriae bacterium HGW-Ignavibacteriae-3]|nr:MAG: hypothetical protein CVV24_12030 [Ignavibacteriae bacterium HGW-Ignavibacteriae-3]